MQIRWSRLGIPLCGLNLHSPAHGRAKWDGKHYVAQCRHCGENILRKERGVWRRERPNLAPGA